MARIKARRPPNSVRIIGGDWRGRRLPVAAVASLRPTPDRVRETLFNWLAASVPGARCLDLFAGTGVLGFEALSRGAAHSIFVEQDAQLVAGLRDTARMLGAECTIVHSAAAEFLASVDTRFDLVFLDPPYQLPLQPVCEALQGRLKPGGLIYVERAGQAEIDALSAWGTVVKSARAGAVFFALVSPPADT